MKKTTLNNLITFVGAAAVFVLLGILSGAGVLSNKISGLIVPIGIYVILAISLNLTVGVLGELSLGHAGFMCVGAYVSGAFSLLFQEAIPQVWLRFTLALIIGGIAAAVMGVAIGVPVLRLHGDYLAIVTLGFGEIMRSIANNIYLVMDKNGVHLSIAKAVENVDAETKKTIMAGPLGIKAPQDTNVWIVTAVLLICLVVLMNFINSKAGRACMSVRDNYIAAQSVGINITKYRLMAFVLSAAIAGVAGGLYSHSITQVVSKKFDYNLSILILVFVVLGGLGSLRGSIIATIILYALPELFREVGDYRMLIYAVVLIGMMIWSNAPFFIQFRERIAATEFAKKVKSIFRKQKTAGGAENE